MYKNNNLLDCFVKVSPYINSLTINDIAIAVSDTEKYLSYVPGKTLNHGVKPMDELKEGTIIKRAMKSRKIVVDRVDNKELFGVPYIGVAIPIIDEETDNIIGGVFFGENTERQDSLRLVSNELSENTHLAKESTEKINAQAQELAALGEQLASLANSFHQQIRNVDEVISFIKTISSQTNLLGLNAAIEASRAGNHGLGFQVVAEEIRKLSTQSSDSTKNIQHLLNNIQKESLEIKDTVDTVNSISQNLAAILQNMSASLEGINTMVSELSIMANNLLNTNK